MLPRLFKIFLIHYFFLKIKTEEKTHFKVGIKTKNLNELYMNKVFKTDLEDEKVKELQFVIISLFLFHHKSVILKS